MVIVRALPSLAGISPANLLAGNAKQASMPRPSFRSQFPQALAGLCRGCPGASRRQAEGPPPQHRPAPRWAAPPPGGHAGGGGGGPVHLGIVEIDESSSAHAVRGQRGRSAGRRIPVVGLLKRAGKGFTQVGPNGSKIELLSVVRDRVRRPAVIPTDGWKACDGLVIDGFRHHRVDHPENEFARGRRHLNGIESFWGYARIRLAQAVRRPPGEVPLAPQSKPGGAGATAVTTCTECSRRPSGNPR